MTNTEIPVMDKIPISALPIDWSEIGSGGEAIIYDYSENEVAKVFRHWDCPYYRRNHAITSAAARKRFWQLQFRLRNIPIFPQNVLRPTALIVTEKDSILGYIMPKIEDYETLDLLWDKIDIEKKIEILLALFDLISEIHAHDIVVGDLIARDLAWQESTKQIFLFDSEGMSYGGFPCQAFSIGYADRSKLEFTNNRKGQLVATLKEPFTKESDWVAYLAICYKVFIGIDPYDIVHPNYPSKEERVAHNISIFSEGVIFPENSQDFRVVIPKDLLYAMFITFEHGERINPTKEMFKKRSEP